MPRLLPRRLLLLFPLLALSLALAAPARACSLDGVPSISVNGHLAGITGGTATQATLAYWAPFTLPAAAPGDTLRLREDLSNVRRSLPAQALAAPFRWRFGDGTGAQGDAVVHRYTRRGWYQITVSYLQPALHRWIVFDRAQLQIVAAGDLWRTNLRYYLAQDAQVVLRGILWAIAAALLAWCGWKMRTGVRRQSGRHVDRR
ncbi:MAG TPA: PKD domain-containing protein [Chloroflexota bacterium]|jgi:hypothetical protein|nr:PKD domain-containing protein [Chloroflexota bacterium]